MLIHPSKPGIACHHGVLKELPKVSTRPILVQQFEDKASKMISNQLRGHFAHTGSERNKKNAPYCANISLSHMKSRQHRRISNYRFQPLAHHDAITARATENWVLLKPRSTIGPRMKENIWPRCIPINPNEKQSCSQLTIAL